MPDFSGKVTLTIANNTSAQSAAAPLPELERHDGEFIVGYVGNFGAGQGLTSIIEAASHLAGEAPGVRFVLAGDGPDKNHVVARAAGSCGRTVSIHPPVAKEQTRAFCNACDVCLVPFAPFPVLQETVPSTIFEVMACERPVLACLDGEGASILRQSNAGLVTRPGQPREIADGIKQLLAMSSDDRRTLGRNDRAFVSQRYSRDSLATWKSLLQWLAEEHARPNPGSIHRIRM